MRCGRAGEEQPTVKSRAQRKAKPPGFGSLAVCRTSSLVFRLFNRAGASARTGRFLREDLNFIDRVVGSLGAARPTGPTLVARAALVARARAGLTAGLGRTHARILARFEIRQG